MITPRMSRTKRLLLIGTFAGALASLAVVADAATESVVYSFQNNGEDGLLPSANLIDVQGTLYGTTYAGGTGRCSNGCGTVFSIDAATGAETVLYSFSGGTSTNPGSLVRLAGKLFGTAQDGGHRYGGMLFSLNPKSDAFKKRYSFCNLYNCSDGANPNPGLLDSEGTLYGTTNAGGTYGLGTVFSFELKTGPETVLHSFGGEGDGYGPLAGLLSVKGVLYGTTGFGGSGSHCGDFDTLCGTVFSLDPATGAETVIYSFCKKQGCTDGQVPRSNLIKLNGRLFGTTEEGGTHNIGTAYSINLSKGTEKVLHSFGGPDGAYPVGVLVNVNGIFYGTTDGGGSSGTCGDGCGTVFSFDPITGAETVVYSFCTQADCVDGALPTGGLLNVNGMLYGVTYYGGSGTCNSAYGGCGTVFSITP